MNALESNLSFYTTEEQIIEVFKKCGEIRRIVMGLNRNTKTPCGFCFVEYYTHQDATDCVKYLTSTAVDDRVIRVELDPGFAEGRQYGRGKQGGQVRDEFRTNYDPGRGGYGAPEPATTTPTTTTPDTNKKRYRDSNESSHDSKRQHTEAEKNPRFRENDSDSDEED